MYAGLDSQGLLSGKIKICAQSFVGFLEKVQPYLLINHSAFHNDIPYDSENTIHPFRAITKRIKKQVRSATLATPATWPTFLGLQTADCGLRSLQNFPWRQVVAGGAAGFSDSLHLHSQQKCLYVICGQPHGLPPSPPPCSPLVGHPSQPTDRRCSTAWP